MRRMAARTSASTCDAGSQTGYQSLIRFAGCWPLLANQLTRSGSSLNTQPIVNWPLPLWGEVGEPETEEKPRKCLWQLGIEPMTMLL